MLPRMKNVFVTRWAGSPHRSRTNAGSTTFTAEMKHVRQIETMDCGRAVTQSLAECTFEEAREHFPANVGRFGCAYGTIWFACQNITGRGFRIQLKTRPERMGRYLK